MAVVWDRIQAFANLLPDWAGQGSVSVSTDTVASARDILRALPVAVPVPHVAPSGDGEIVFTWIAGSNRIDAALDADGHLSWASRINGKVSPGGDIALDKDDLTAFNQALETLFV